MATTLQQVVQRIKATEPELRRRGVAHLSLFGSLARGNAGADSDIDIAVEIEAGRSFSLIRMEDTRLMLEDVLGRPVDLGEVESFHPAVRAAFEQDKVWVF
ncbi:nucleotidyltransferase family protein [Magnetospirillum sp. UT-4]|uniref:nucleotidyltransferase family protein n=1 Tax=Magnetospirillum sp. UT-4 TaxID=2681467 RepID=UPI00137F7FD7|nr:nucleotidyltransferase family protein [Magnetospirillum sp. UT-4]CAA7625284.1 DNA polymerase, beta domain protein region [Magnetospirillum sp. UT-4]